MARAGLTAGAIACSDGPGSLGTRGIPTEPPEGAPKSTEERRGRLLGPGDGEDPHSEPQDPPGHKGSAAASRPLGFRRQAGAAAATPRPPAGRETEPLGGWTVTCCDPSEPGGAAIVPGAQGPYPTTGLLPSDLCVRQPPAPPPPAQRHSTTTHTGTRHAHLAMR